VRRTWSDWSAADGPRRRELYRRYIAALAEEVQAAAAIERSVDLEG
jgi:hypothetical protein